MGRQETLCLAHRLETLHLSFSPPRRTMGVLRPVVEIATFAMIDVWQELAPCHAIALQLVRDQDTRRILQTFQETLEEAPRCGRITAMLHQDVQYDAALINRAPEITQFTLDTDEDLVQVPLVTRPRTASTDASAKLAPNFRHHRRMLS